MHLLSLAKDFTLPRKCNTIAEIYGKAFQVNLTRRGLGSRGRSNLLKLTRQMYCIYAYLLCQEGIKIEALYFQGEPKMDMHCPLEMKAPHVGPTLMHYMNCASELPSDCNENCP